MIEQNSINKRANYSIQIKMCSFCFVFQFVTAQFVFGQTSIFAFIAGKWSFPSMNPLNV